MRLSKIDFIRLCMYRSHIFDLKTRKVIKTDYGKILDLIDKKDKKNKTKLKKLMKKVSMKL